MMTHGSFQYFIDRIEVGGELRIDGWAFHDRLGACGVEVLTDGGVRAPDMRLQGGLARRDVALAFGVPAAERSGFLVIAALSPGGAAVFLRLTAGGEQAVVPLMVREDLALRSWRPVCERGPEAVEYRFLTERGLRYASAAPPGLARAREVLARFAGMPPDQPAPPAISVGASLAAPVSIVIPVYGGKSFLAPLVNGLLETVEPRHRIILVDDGNPDRSVTAFLVALAAAADQVTVVHKPVNEGYLKAVADGVEVANRLNPDGHVVLLNTDVELPPGWLERLVGPIERTPWIASTTPLTNAGTICGFPTMPEDNPPFLDAPVAEIDAAFATLGDLPPVELPTGVGFCMALNRRALRAIGFFDLDAFGRGYGEEVDWCRRALRHGFTNVAVPNLYVHHKHGGSFPGEEKQRLIQRSGDIIRQRYPEFDAEVQDFIRADPLRPVRAAAGVRMLVRRGHPGVVLMFDHAGHGGTTTFRAAEIARLHGAGQAVLLVRPTLRPSLGMPEKAVDIELLHRDAAFRFPANDLGDLAALAGALPLTEVVVSSLVGHADPAGIMAFVRALRTGRGVPLRLLHHDYFPICPSLNLIDAEDRFCGVPSPERCRTCAPANPHMRRPEGQADEGTVDVAEHRRLWQGFFDLADRHAVFSRSSLAILRRAFVLPDARVRVVPHLANHVTVTPLPSPPPPDPVARVAIVGGINVAKGSCLLAAMVDLAEQHRLPLVFELFGNLDRPIHSFHLHDNGPYEPDQLARRLAERGCHAVFLPSIWPETHCYVLDEVVGLGLPVGAFDLGAPPERLRHWSNGFIVSPITPEAALTALLRAIGLRVPAAPRS